MIRTISVRRRTLAVIGVVVGACALVGGAAAAIQARYEGAKEEADAVEELREMGREGKIDSELVEWMARGPSSPTDLLPEEFLDPQFKGPATKPTEEAARQLSLLGDESAAAASKLAEAWDPLEEQYQAAGGEERTEMLVAFAREHEDLIRVAKDASDTYQAEFKRLMGEK